MIVFGSNIITITSSLVLNCLKCQYIPSIVQSLSLVHSFWIVYNVNKILNMIFSLKTLISLSLVVVRVVLLVVANSSAVASCGYNRMCASYCLCTVCLVAICHTSYLLPNKSWCQWWISYPLVRQLGRFLRWLRDWPSHLSRKPRLIMASRPVEVARKTVAKSTERIVPNIAQLDTFQLPWLRFFRDFPSVVRRMPGYNVWCKYGTRPAIPLSQGDLSNLPVHSRVLTAVTMPLCV